METGFLNRRLETKRGPRDYVVYVPRGYDASQEWPLILYLHGSGERGDDGLRPSGAGLGQGIRRFPDRWPALVLFPQCPKKKTWADIQADVQQVFMNAVSEWRIDMARVYVTGVSLGGYAAFKLPILQPDMAAAIVPVCGGGAETDAEALAKVPLWAWHGAQDTVVDPEESRKMILAIEAAGGKPRYTELPDAAHDAWNVVYEDPGLPRWLFQQRKKG